MSALDTWLAFEKLHFGDASHLLSLLASVVMMIVAVMKLGRGPASFGRRQPPRTTSSATTAFVPWEVAKEATEGVLVVDCTHPSLPTITHHKGQRNPPGGSSDTSTGLVLDTVGTGAPAAAPWLSMPAISVNHFDADALLSMWSYMHSQEALQHSPVLRHAARIGDLREAGLGTSAEAAAARRWDGIETEAQLHHALQLSCWINSVELSHFSPPYVDKDAESKHRWFLQRLPGALTPNGIAALREVRTEVVESLVPRLAVECKLAVLRDYLQDWQAEYDAVMEGWQLMERGRPATVQRHDELGLVVLRPPRPLHYYSLFSFAICADVVVTCMPGNCYEVESR